MSVLLAIAAGLIALSTGRVRSWSAISEFFSGVMAIARALNSMSTGAGTRRTAILSEERGRHYV